MNGWATDIAVWQESSLLGAQTGTAYRPTGIVEISSSPDVVNRWTTIDPLRAQKTEATLQQAYTVRMTRQFDKSTFSNFWLASISDNNPTITSFVVMGTAYETRLYNLIDNPAPLSFGMEFILEDGSHRRYSGMVVTKIEYTLASGRVTMEEVTLSALRSDTFTGSVRSKQTDPHVMHSGLMAYFNLRVGNTWATPHSLDKQITFSSQLIFQRDLRPTQFNASGLATRYTVNGGWELVGKVVVRAPALWSQFHNLTACVAQWNFGTPTNYVDFQANVNAKLSGQTILSDGQIDMNIDFQAFRYGRSLFQIQKGSQS